MLAPVRAPTPDARSLDDLARELERFAASPPDALAAIPVHDDGALDIDGWAALLLSLLEALRARDTTNDAPLLADIERPGWDFVFGGVQFFIAVFAPCYPIDHARSSGSTDTGIVLLQPERSFRHCGVSSLAPNRADLSESIWRRFAAVGRPYDLTLTTQRPKTWRYIKPMLPTDPPVRWWEPRRRSGRDAGA